MAKVFNATERFREERNADAPEKLKPVDWAILMKYYRETGNLLPSDLEDGRPDRRSRDFLRDPEIVQRLIDNNMILLPGGWLTPEAKKQCEKLELQIRKRQIKRSTRSKTPAVLKKFAQTDSDSKKLQPDPQNTEKTKKKKRKAKEPAIRPGKMTTADWAILMKYDRKTGKLDLKDSSIINDAGTIKRLLGNKLILPDGTLTPAPLKKFARIDSDKNKLQPDSQNTKKTKKKKRKAKEQAIGPGKLTTADWAILMKFYREPGNLLQYDLEDGRLDRRLRDILRDPKTVQRLIDNNMILLPGGRLTPEAKKQCEKLELQIRQRQIARSTRSKTPAVLKKFAQTDSDSKKLEPDPQDKNDTKKKESKAKEAAVRPGKLTTADWAILMKYYREPGNLLQYDREDGRLDRRLRDILRDPKTVQRLIGNNMILPGGQFTPEAKKQCEKLALQFRQRQIERSARSNKRTNKDARRQRSESYEVMKHKDLSALSKYDREINRSGETETSEQAATSLRNIMHVVFKRQMQILIFFFAVVITVAIGNFLAKPVYEASAQILVKMGRESVYVPTGGNMSPIINYNREERINSEIEILKSSSLAEKVVLAMGPTVLYESLKEQKPGIFDRIKAYLLPENGKKLTSDERKALKLKIATSIFQNSLTIESVKKSNIVQVTFEHQEPRLVAMAVNNLADIYLDRHLEVHKTPQSHKFFQEQTELLKNKLEQSEIDLKVLKKQYHITSLEQERTLMLSQLSGLRSDLNKTSSQIVETEKRLSQLKRQLSITPRTIAQGEETDLNREVINTLQTRLVELQLKEKELSAKYSDRSRLVQNAKKEIQMVRNKLAEQEKKQYGRKRTGANPTYQRLQGDFYRNEAELSAIKAKASTQKAQLINFQAKLAELNKIEIKLNQLKQQVEVDRENYRLYLSKYEESRISNAMDTEKISSVSLLEPARQPMGPVKPKKMLNLLLAVFLGAFGGIGLAFFMEYLNDKLERVEDVEECLQLPVLASIPELKPREQAKKRRRK